MKKGNIHVDWAISMGIFMISLLALFLVFKPGIKAIYKEKVLLDIVDEKFKSEVLWTVKKVPIFIKQFDEYSIPTDNDPYIKINLVGNDWLFYPYPDSNYPNLGFSATPNTITIKCFALPCTTTPSNGPIVLTFYQNNVNADSPYLTAGCFTTIAGAELETNDADGPTALCDQQLGATEDIHGVNGAWLSLLQANTYSPSFKQSWNYPESREFAIYEDDNKILGADPFEQKNVFVREVKYWRLSQDGTRIPTTIYFRVW